MEETWAYTLTGSLDIVINRALSKSFIAILDDARKKDVIAGIKEIIEQSDEKTWIDKEAGTFEYPYKTLAVVIKRK